MTYNKLQSILEDFAKEFLEDAHFVEMLKVQNLSGDSFFESDAKWSVVCGGWFLKIYFGNDVFYTWDGSSSFAKTRDEPTAKDISGLERIVRSASSKCKSKVLDFKRKN